MAANQEDDERLAWFGDLNDPQEKKSAQTRLGKTITTFDQRVLGGIRMLIDTSVKETQKQKVRFNL